MSNKHLALAFYILEALLWFSLVLWEIYMVIAHPFNAVQTIGPLCAIFLAYLFHRAYKKFEEK